VNGADEVAAVLARWRAALAWQPSEALLAAARGHGRRHYRRGWPGFPPTPFSLDPPPPVPWAATLLAAYDEAARFNREHFDSLCPPLKITVNPRLRSVAARIYPARRVLELNPHRLAQLPETRTETVFHEMIHLWLYVQGLGAGHSALFRGKMAERGHAHTRYGRADDVQGPRHEYPGSDRRVVYRCPCCEVEFAVRKRYGRAMLCRACLEAGRGAHRIIEIGERHV
jgi:predicted SprT family Zn-dependent metalloprotease